MWTSALVTLSGVARECGDGRSSCPHVASSSAAGRVGAARMRYKKHMEFTLDGERFELTPELVCARLRGHLPEGVREYWVEIDGVRWPVKQVISVATGVSNRRRFQSQDSRRWLKSLGFTIGQGGSEVGRASVPRSTTAPLQTYEASELESLEPVEVTCRFTWLRVGPISLDMQQLPFFPPLPSEPGLYRFDFGVDDEGVRVIYIGESVSLRRRASNYRNAKTDRSRQRTSRRIHKEVVAHLSAGGAIEFAIATAVVLADGQPPICVSSSWPGPRAAGPAAPGRPPRSLLPQAPARQSWSFCSRIRPASSTVSQ